jgi:hypothetical protein
VYNLSSVAGSFRGEATERLRNTFLGAELYGSMKLGSGSGWRVDGLSGLRYLRLNETYTFDTASPFIPPAPADVWVTKDEFDALNKFYGAQLGARVRGDWGTFFLNGVVKIGLGAMEQSVTVDGFLITNDFNNFGEPQTFPGNGYFTSPALRRNHNRTVFAFVPEAGLTAGWRLGRVASVVVGYTFLYLSDVARPGNHVDPAFDPVSAVPTRPSFKFQGSDFWAHGVNVGFLLEF